MLQGALEESSDTGVREELLFRGAVAFDALGRHTAALAALKELQEKAKEKTFVPSASGFGGLRGKLPFPVRGRILSTFGKNENPKFNTFTVQKGIEIEASLGAGIRAVHDGRVLYSDWFKGYGKILIIDHGEGYYTLSGHASALLKAVGEEVRTGDVVALVGDTGSLKGPCLYFEIRQRGRPLDPMEWLKN